jgi:regulator of replication initiation timing
MHTYKERRMIASTIKDLEEKLSAYITKIAEMEKKCCDLQETNKELRILLDKSRTHVRIEMKIK